MNDSQRSGQPKTPQKNCQVFFKEKEYQLKKFMAIISNLWEKENTERRKFTKTSLRRKLKKTMNNTDYEKYQHFFVLLKNKRHILKNKMIYVFVYFIFLFKYETIRFMQQKLDI